MSAVIHLLLMLAVIHLHLVTAVTQLSLMSAASLMKEKEIVTNREMVIVTSRVMMLKPEGQNLPSEEKKRYEDN